METPLSIYGKLANCPYSYLFESVEGGDKWARYSLIGLKANRVIKVLKNQIEIYQDGGLVDSFYAQNPLDYIDYIFKNNPYIYHRFEPGDFDVIFTDHDRAYTDNINTPLTEQILLRFGFTLDEVKNIDCRPHLYYDEDENPNPDIKDDYGCLLFASRIDKLKGRWDDKNLIKEARKYKDIPVYYYSEFDLKGTEWEELFPIRYNFADLNLNLRQQMLIKSRAKFNIGYQAGINDAVSKHSNNIILTPYDDIKENIIRNVKYIHFDGKIKQI